MRFRIVLGSATFVMLALSWPLWTAPEAIFPRVPFARGAAWTAEPPAVAWIGFAALLAAVGTAGWARRGARVSLGASTALLLALVLQDQERFQPWVYQYLVLALLLLALSPGQALRYARWWFAGLYLYSGLSKLDVAFTHEMGASFLAVLVHPFGLDPAL